MATITDLNLFSLFLISTYTFCITDAGSNANCPIGWFHYGSSCFLFTTDELNWYDAESSCRAHDARLAEVYSHDVVDFLSVTAMTYGQSYWLGGRDDVIEGRWQWASTGSQFTVTDWAPGEPNNDKGQDCLQIYKDSSFKWDDNFCNLKERFICESKFPGANIFG